MVSGVTTDNLSQRGWLALMYQLLRGAGSNFKLAANNAYLRTYLGRGTVGTNSGGAPQTPTLTRRRAIMDGTATMKPSAAAGQKPAMEPSAADEAVDPLKPGAVAEAEAEAEAANEEAHSRGPEAPPQQREGGVRIRDNDNRPSTPDSDSVPALEPHTPPDSPADHAAFFLGRHHMTTPLTVRQPLRGPPARINFRRDFYDILASFDSVNPYDDVVETGHARPISTNELLNQGWPQRAHLRHNPYRHHSDTHARKREHHDNNSSASHESRFRILTAEPADAYEAVAPRRPSRNTGQHSKSG